MKTIARTDQRRLFYGDEIAEYEVELTCPVCTRFVHVFVPSEYGWKCKTCDTEWFIVTTSEGADWFIQSYVEQGEYTEYIMEEGRHFPNGSEESEESRRRAARRAKRRRKA